MTKDKETFLFSFLIYVSDKCTNKEKRKIVRKTDLSIKPCSTIFQLEFRTLYIPYLPNWPTCTVTQLLLNQHQQPNLVYFLSFSESIYQPICFKILFSKYT